MAPLRARLRHIRHRASCGRIDTELASEYPSGAVSKGYRPKVAAGLAGQLLKIGGPDQVRTDDLLNAIEALFQLSYEPIRMCEG
jgi:hypothetical protein